ncbi:hypothetical protein QBC34DRAFT_389789 [Podospora aff. communis PSN243]|uniref:Uncharacterized protein n=1 Tax=Podospora aff. communis PSN243 TaxID=3040156 RepID=A0AAV9H5V2_9PEZI|nr:hypothetical protein QBC34DRAFT_389789 [Podospora aff. communis PSN243]
MSNPQFAKRSGAAHQSLQHVLSLLIPQTWQTAQKHPQGINAAGPLSRNPKQTGLLSFRPGFGVQHSYLTMGCSSSQPIRSPLASSINKKLPKSPVSIPVKTYICTVSEPYFPELELREKADQSRRGLAGITMRSAITTPKEKAAASEKASPCNAGQPGREIRRRAVSSRVDVLHNQCVNPSLREEEHPFQSPQPRISQPFQPQPQSVESQAFQPQLQPLQTPPFHPPPSPPPLKTEPKTSQPRPHPPLALANPQPKHPPSWLTSQPQPTTSPIPSNTTAHFLTFVNYLQIRETYHTCFLPTSSFSGREVEHPHALPVAAATDDLVTVFNIVYCTASSRRGSNIKEDIVTIACPGRDVRRVIERFTSFVGGVVVVRYGDETAALDELPKVLGLGRKFWVELRDAEMGEDAKRDG